MIKSQDGTRTWTTQVAPILYADTLSCTCSHTNYEFTKAINLLKNQYKLFYMIWLINIKTLNPPFLAVPNIN